MKIKKIKKIRVNETIFKVIWDNKPSSINRGEFYYGSAKGPPRLIIGICNLSDGEILEILLHELMEIVAVECRVRLRRPDCDGDYIFVYDHRQHTLMMAMLSGLLNQFIK